jgi:hypothetical protein
MTGTSEIKTEKVPEFLGAGHWKGWRLVMVTFDTPRK